MHTTSENEERFLGNVMGASENFWEDMTIFEGEKDPEVLKEKMLTGKYVVIGCGMDRLSGGPEQRKRRRLPIQLP